MTGVNITIKKKKRLIFYLGFYIHY